MTVTSGELRKTYAKEKLTKVYSSVSITEYTGFDILGRATVAKILRVSIESRSFFGYLYRRYSIGARQV